MPPIFSRRAALLLIATALTPFGQAWAAPSCGAGAGTAVVVGTVADVPTGAAQRYTVDLGAGQGVIVDLSGLRPEAPAASDGDDEHADSPPPPRSLALCDARGKLLAPLPGEVFEKGGSFASTPDGERLRFVSPTAAKYTIVVTAGDAPRELLVRGRTVSSSQAPIVAATLGGEKSGTVSSAAPMVFSFDAPAGQWVELKATSERDTILRLAGADRQGDYSVLAENDDSDGLNPRIRRKLAVAGTYYVQVDSLADEAGDFTFSSARISAPKPPPAPSVLRAGAPVTGKLADSDSAVLYTLPVAAGHSYRLSLTATYDGVVAIGLPNPLEPDDGGDGPDAGFAEIKSQDGGTTGTEKLNFTARGTGQLLVRVKCFGIGETDGAYSLTATDLGG
jgi:hypothetical protein